MASKQKTGVVDVGGGMRGVYAAGVFDRCIDDDVSFDVALGVSAGSANVASFLSGQLGRNFAFYIEYSSRKEYMGLSNFITKDTYIDLDYIYSTLTDEGGENPFDFDAFMANPTDWRVVACDAQTGQVKYFDRDDVARNNYGILKASSAIPVVCHPYKVAGREYFDGALGDVVPIQKAYQMGCTKVVLILTRLRDSIRSGDADRMLARLLARKYPLAAQRLRARAQEYNFEVSLAKRLEEDGCLLIVAPEDTFGVNTLSHEREAMMKFYAEGYRDGGRIKAFLTT